MTSPRHSPRGTLVQRYAEHHQGGISSTVDEISSTSQLGTDSLNKVNEKRVLAFAADACALCCLQCTGAILLMLYLAQIGLWSWLFHEIYTALPHTFAWEKLLRVYGSHYDDCVDRSGDTEIELKPWSLCPNFYTMPCVPIIAIVLLILNFFSGSSCLSKPKSKRMYTMVASGATWNFLFTVIAITFSSYYFHKDIRGLERSMKRELSKGRPETSRWELTQIVQKCCGIRSRNDWDVFSNVTDDYPTSCYANKKRHVDSIFTSTCYEEEYGLVKFYAAFEIGLLCAGLIISIFFLCLVTAIHGGARGNWSHGEETLAAEGAAAGAGAGGETADVYFVTTPHYRHHHFHHRHGYAGKGQHLIVDDAESQGFYMHHNPGMESPSVVSTTL